MNYTYKLFEGSDKYYYVSVQPLMEDIKNSINTMVDIDISKLDDKDTQIFNLKILGLRTIYEFLGSLVMEQDLKKKREEFEGEIPLNTQSNFTVVGASPTKH